MTTLDPTDADHLVTLLRAMTEARVHVTGRSLDGDRFAAEVAAAEIEEAARLKLYARQASNRQLEIDAAEIRMRAERRLGELIRAQKETVGLRGPQHSRGGGSKGSIREPLPDAPPTLADAGIDKKLSSRAQKLAAAATCRAAQLSRLPSILAVS